MGVKPSEYDGGHRTRGDPRTDYGFVVAVGRGVAVALGVGLAVTRAAGVGVCVGVGLGVGFGVGVVTACGEGAVVLARATVVPVLGLGRIASQTDWLVRPAAGLPE